MGLDIRTLFVADVAVLFATAAAFFVFWYRRHDDDWLVWWASGAATIGIAMSILGLAGPAPPPVAGLPASTLFIAGFLMIWTSVRRLNGRPIDWRTMVVVLMIFLAVMASAFALEADLRQRAGIVMGTMALCATGCAWEAAFGAPLARSRVVLAAILSVMAMLLGVTAVVTALWWHPPVASFSDLLGDALPLVNSIGTLCLCIFALMLANERASDRYRQLASTDDLTGLPNRRYFLEQAGRFGREAGDNGTPASVLMMDLDHFSEVNKRFGHAGGDQALRAFASVLRQGMRSQDVVARYGGEEFCAFLPATDAAEAVHIAERLRHSVAALSINVGGASVAITVSIGVAPVREGDLMAAIRAADAALYKAKGWGRDQVALAVDSDSRFPAAPRGSLRIVR